LPTLYALAGEQARARGLRLEPRWQEFFASENDRLAEMSLARADALQILRSREMVAAIIASHVGAAGNPGGAGKWRSLQERLAEACRKTRESHVIPDDL
jgi:hypothetical protein